MAEFGERREGDIGYDYLNGVIEGPPVPLSKEIAWINARLVTNSETIGKFRADANRLDASCVRGAYDQALTHLNDIVKRYGESMWSVQLRLALEQRQGGLEAQKAFLEHVRSRYRQGILSYVAYNTSVRNEERTSWRRFELGIRARSARREDRALADYLNYRLLDAWPDTTVGIANVLRLEQSHSIVDIYETFVRLAQFATESSNLGSLRSALCASARALAPVNDFRLHRITGTETGLYRGNEASAGLASGRLAAALRATRSSELSASDPWLSIYAAGVFAAAGKEAPSKTGLFSNVLIRFFSPRGSTTQAVQDLRNSAKISPDFRLPEE